MDYLPAITIRQPWPWLILQGIKRFENRSWRILTGAARLEYRGPLIIHAAKPLYRLSDQQRKLIGRVAPHMPAAETLPTGAIVGVVDLVGCLSPDQCGGDPLATGPICWQLANPRRLATPIPYRGAERVFWVERSLVFSDWNCPMHPLQDVQMLLDRVLHE
jgi:hypothetical protein